MLFLRASQLCREAAAAIHIHGRVQEVQQVGGSQASAAREIGLPSGCARWSCSPHTNMADVLSCLQLLPK